MMTASFNDSKTCASVRLSGETQIKVRFTDTKSMHARNSVFGISQYQHFTSVKIANKFIGGVTKPLMI